MKLDSALINRAVPPGSMRYYAWLYAPQQHRDVLAALFLIEAELHDSARAAHEVAHIRLQWWREEIDRLIAGKALHPAMQVLQTAAQPQVDFKLLHSTMFSAAQELAKATYETDAELTQYLRSGLGSLAALAAHHFTATPSAPLIDAATQLGAFIRQVEIIRDLRMDFHHGRLYLPLAELDELNIEYETLHGDDWPETFAHWLKLRSERQLTAYQTLRQGLLSSEKQALRPLLVLSELHARVLQRVVGDPIRHTRQRVELSPFGKLWTAWKAARKT